MEHKAPPVLSHRRCRRGRVVIAAGLAMACLMSGGPHSITWAQPVPARAALDDAHAELAGKFLEAAEDILHNGIPGTHQWQQGAALLEAACELNPREPSYPRLLAETWRQLGDNDQVIAALTKYTTAAKLANLPDDQVAQVELIDRYVSRMQTVDQRLSYLRDVLAKPTLAPEVKAHAAVLCVPLLVQRSDAEAEGMITQALRLDPLNMAARRLQYQMVARQGSPLERIQVLLGMVLSNPTQQDVLEELARQLSEAGLPDASLDWYRRVLLIGQRAGVPSQLDILLDYAAQAYIAGQYADADLLVNQVIDASPRDPNAWFMRLAFDRTNPERTVAYGQELETASRVFMIQAANAAKKIMGPVKVEGLDGAAQDPPLTKPAVDPEADVHAEIEGIKNEELRTLIARIKQGQSPPGLAELFASALSDLAWFDIYFQNAPEEAVQWVTILKAIVPPDDIRAIRMQGWLDFANARFAQAQDELASIQTVDPLAMIGLIQMTALGMVQGAPATRPATPTLPAAKVPTTQAAAPVQTAAQMAKNYEKADLLSKQLMARTRTGLAGAMVYAAFRERKLAPDPRPDAVAIRAELNKFPAQWIHIIERPEQFYLVIGTPVKLPHKLGEPMLATVGLQNISPFPITVGPEGVISPDLFFDVWIGMNGNRQFPHAAYDRIANVLVLPAGALSTQIVRLDQGPIAQALREKPSSDLTMFAKVTTNPIARGSDIVPGPAGLRRDFQKQLVRKNSAMADNVKKQQILIGLSGLPSERMAVLDTLQAHVLAARDPNADGRTLALAPELNDEINNARKDSISDVAAWATFQAMKLAKPADKIGLVATLAASHDWEVRLLAGVAALDLPPNERQPIAERLSRDTLPEITLFGAATAEDIAQPTSRPAMQIEQSHKAPTTTGPALPNGPALGPATQP
jgi:tetratricopeptide (TPR) repeat protein